MEVEDYATEEVELELRTEEVLTIEDIDNHRFRCTQCAEVSYYSARAKAHFEGKYDEFIASTLNR